VSEVPLSLRDLSQFGEFFITSTSMHVMPIVRIGSALVGEGQVGPVTLDLMDRFERYHRHYVESRR
jgi:branched-subunit amino acid aminotransferase/4-amino-4-deoxychorismate lyase